MRRVGGKRNSKRSQSPAAEPETQSGDDAPLSKSETPVPTPPTRRTTKRASSAKKTNNTAVKNSAVAASDSEDDQPLTKQKKTAPVVKSSGGRRGRKTKAEKKELPEEVVEEYQNGDDSAEYEVEKIVSHRMKGQRLQYLIRWKGYAEEHDTWELAKTLKCPELVKKYDDEQDEENAEKDYEVNKIIEVHTKRDGSREFLVNWKGFPNNSNTWEPEDNLDCKELVTKFMKKVDQAKSISQKELREKRGKIDRYNGLNFTVKGRRSSKRSNNKQRVNYEDDE